MARRISRTARSMRGKSMPFVAACFDGSFDIAVSRFLSADYRQMLAGSISVCRIGLVGEFLGGSERWAECLTGFKYRPTVINKKHAIGLSACVIIEEFAIFLRPQIAGSHDQRIIGPGHVIVVNRLIM